MTPHSALPTPHSMCRAWRLTAWMAGGFALLAGLGMLAGHFNTRADDPLKSAGLKQYKEKLAQSPADEQLKQDIRQLDLRLRQRYFRQLSRMNSGVWLLLGAVALFALASKRVAHYQRQPPLPQPNPEASTQSARAGALARWCVAACGAGLGAGLFFLRLGSSSALPERPEAIAKLLGAPDSAAPAANDAAPMNELRRNWPRFRGADGGGVSAFTNAPASWDLKSGAGLAWKSPVPAPGFNSPIVWDGRVFFSGGDAAKREVFCLDAKTGRPLWRQPIEKVPGSPTQPGEIPDTTGYAAASMASDGRRLYVFFANADLAALSFEGKVLWARSLAPLKNPYGHATSLATWRDRIILQLDQGDSEEGRSKLYELDGHTGQVIWQKPRKVGASWATPILIEAAGKSQIITLAVPWVIAYSAEDGAELWRVEGLSGEITPSPIFAGGMVFVASPSDKLLAIRPDGQGDVTKTHVVWTTEDNVPDVTSPASNGELVFALTTSGLLTCWNAKDGKKLWEHDYETECHASPSIAANRLYLFTQKGAAVVVEAAPQFKELFRTDMADAFHASPAFVQDRFFLRGVTNIYCIEAPRRQ